jgi:hypothetical protein
MEGTMNKFIPLLLMLTTGCAYHMPIQISSTHFSPEQAEIIGTYEGVASRYYFLSLPAGGNDSIGAAVDDALSKSGGDTLINIFADRHVFYFPFPGLSIITRVQTTVRGTAIEYTSTKRSEETQKGSESKQKKESSLYNKKLEILPTDRPGMMKW